MLLRDGRNQVHDLGPRQDWQPSLMKPISGEPTGSGRWQKDMKWMFDKPEAMKRRSKTEVNKQYREANIEVYRVQERERQRRHRQRMSSAAALIAAAHS